MQAVLSMEPPPARDRMVEWLLSKGVILMPKNDRAIPPICSRPAWESIDSGLLVKAGAKEVKEEWPKPAGG